MIASGTSTSPHTSQGLLQQVELLDRSVTVVFESGPMMFDVPPACEVLLNGERVKLRMLQPRDHVTITYCRRQGLLTALRLEVWSRSGIDPSKT